MNTPIFTLEKSFTKKCHLGRAIGLALMFVFLAEPAQAEWKVDFSRRLKAARETDLNAAATRASDERAPASAALPLVEEKEPKKGVFDVLFDSGEPIQDLVILHTEKGFLPATVRVRKNGRYRIHVVNVNERDKNVSFILDGFSEHHATYYGKIKTFSLEPKKEGSFSFQSPETSSEGKLVVFNPQATLRAPASEDGK